MNPAGQPVWSTYFYGGGGNFTWFGGVAIDKYGNAYVAGAGAGAPTNGRGWGMLVKFAPNGTFLWQTRFGGYYSGDGAPTAMAYDPSNDVVYIAGQSAGNWSYSTDPAWCKPQNVPTCDSVTPIHTTTNSSPMFV